MTGRGRRRRALGPLAGPLVGLAVLAAAATAPAQEIRYVTDRLVLTVRAGPGESYEILRSITSGEAVRVLEVDDGGYARVRLANGLEGWLQTRFLSDTEVAADRLARAEERLAALEREAAALRERNAELETVRTGAADTAAALEETRDRLREEVASLRAAAVEPRVPLDEHRSLEARLARLQERADALRAHNEELRARGEREWFLYGGGLALGGVLLGGLLSRLRGRRKSSWGRL